MHSAIDVSSVHCPGFNRKGPPPTMSVIGLEGARPLELIRGAHRVADSQAHESAARPRKKIRHDPSVTQGHRIWAPASASRTPEVRGARGSAPASSPLETRRQAIDVPNSEPSRYVTPAAP